jgi:prepilin-type N-terminal cleavage/methylation domain-containing protein
MNPGGRRYGRSGDEKGFTLIELMVSLVVMTLGLFSVIHLQVVTVRGHAYARERTQATQIALGVAEEMRSQAKGWLAKRDGVKVAFNSLFPDIVLITPAPAVGDQLDFADLRSLTKYAGQEIAADADFINAWRINTYGYSPDSGTALPVQWVGAIYRVHCVAHRVNLPLPAPQNTLVRVTVIVSWDNKDHGEGTDWANWVGEDNFWRRHMVTKTFYLYRTSTF